VSVSPVLTEWCDTDLTGGKEEKKVFEKFPVKRGKVFVFFVPIEVRTGGEVSPSATGPLEALLLDSRGREGQPKLGQVSAQTVNCESILIPTEDIGLSS